MLGILGAVGRDPAFRRTRNQPVALADGGTLRPGTEIDYWCLPGEVHQAEGALSVHLGVTVDEAAQILGDRAAAAGVTVLDAAMNVLEDNARTRCGGLLDPWGSC